MCGKIDCFEKNFKELITEGKKAKPILLLAVLDLIGQKKINREFIDISADLAAAYASYWQHVEPLLPANPALPFYAMGQEPFWNLVPRTGISSPGTMGSASLEQLKEYYLGAKLDKELFPLLLMEPLRKRLQTVLISTYFSPAIQPLLIGQCRTGDTFR